MFGSQALETAIGLAVLFFVLATATSAVVELVSKRLKKRHRDLEQAIGTMLAGGEVSWTGSATLDDRFRGTTIYRSADVAAGKAGVTYLSARSFADAAVELARTADDPPARHGREDGAGLRRFGDDLVRFKAGLESWFDETMAGVESQYKKWATTWLFVSGVVLAVLVNASAIDVAADLWNDAATRAAVVAAAESTASAGQGATTIEDVARSTEALEELRLPVGWPEPPFHASHDGGWWVSHVIGWLLTGALLMLGAPFWFDLLSRLVSLRNSGKAPEVAARDDTSATAAAIRAEATTISEAPPGRGPGAPAPRSARRVPRDGHGDELTSGTRGSAVGHGQTTDPPTGREEARAAATPIPHGGFPPVRRQTPGPASGSSAVLEPVLTGQDTDRGGHHGTGADPMSDFDTRPGDEIEPVGEGGEFDDFIGPDLAEEDVNVDDIHERDETDPTRWGAGRSDRRPEDPAGLGGALPALQPLRTRAVPLLRLPVAWRTVRVGLP